MYQPLKHVGFPLTADDAGTATRLRVIGDRTIERHYGHSLPRNLERFNLVGKAVPLKEGFDGHSQTRLSIGVHDQSAVLTSEQGIVFSIMPISDSTAAGTPLGRMVRVNPVQRNAAVKAAAFKNPSEKIERDSQHLLVELPALRPELGEPLDRDIRAILLSKGDDLPDHLPEICLDKITLPVPHTLQLLEGVEVLQDGPPLGKVMLLVPDMLAEVSLLQHISFGSQDAISKVLVVDVDTEDVLSWNQWRVFLGEVCHHTELCSQSEGLAFPSCTQQRTESLEVVVPLDWDCDSLLRVESEFNEEETPGLEGLAVTWYVELYGESIDHATVLPPSTPLNVTLDLGVQAGGSESLEDLSVEVHEGLAALPFIENPVVFGKSEFGERCYSRPLALGYFCLKQDSSLHAFPTRTLCCRKGFKFSQPIPPTAEACGFPW